ncbi:MAG: TonB-dependent receptor [Nibricoccus sp.]
MRTNKPLQLPHFARIASVIAAAVSSVLSGAAQTEPASATDKQDVVKLDRYLVTGSSLTMPRDAAPLTIVTRYAIERGGVATNLLEVLRKQVPALSGSGNIGLSNASTGVTSTYGGARVSLHNSGTLVLLNGRRLATNGANARNGISFVDVSQFPLAAIERVEVLTDGASAVYGSDATGGVVNVILKSAFNGAEVGDRYAFSTADGDYSERSAHFVSGVKQGRLGVIVTGEYSKNTPLFQDQRPFSNVALAPNFSGVVTSTNAVVAGTYYLKPAINSPRELVVTGPGATAANMNALVTAGAYVSGASEINLAPAVTLNAAKEQSSSYTGLTYSLFDKRLEAFGNVLFTRANTSTQLPAQATSFTVADDTPYNPINASVPGVNFRYIPAPRIYRMLTHEATVTAGLKGILSPDWNWELAYSRSQNRILARTANVLYSPNLDLAVRGGYDANGNVLSGGGYSRVYKDFSAPALPTNVTTAAQIQAFYAAQRTTDNTVLQPALDPFARPEAINPAALANVLGTARADLKSGLDSVDFVLRGKFDLLPAGQAELALGGNYRDEKLAGMPDDNSRNTGPTSQRWSGGTFFDPIDQSRFVRSGFAELHVPVASPKQQAFLAHALDFTVAFRMEDFNESGVSRVPKYGVRWQPFDEQLTFRGTYGKGFAAPTLFAMYGPATQGNSSSLSAALGYGDGVSRQGIQRVSSNPNLRPSTSRSESVGFVLVPKVLPGLRISVDYLDLQINGLVGTVGGVTIVQNVNQLGTGSPYADLVTLNGAPITTVGQIRAFLDAGGATNQIMINDLRRNYTGAVVRTVDTSIDYVLPAFAIGQFEVGTTGTFFLDDKIQALPSEPAYEYAGLTTSTEGTMPGYHFYSHLSWSKAGWGINLGHTYIPAVDDLGTGGSTFANSTTLKRTRVGSFTSWDVSASYDFKLGYSRFYIPRNIAIRAGINNVAGHLPPPAPQAFPSTSAMPAPT